MNARLLLLPLLFASAFLLPTAAHADVESWNARVHVSSPVAVELQRFDNASASWTFACAPPCDEDLPLADDYRFMFTGSKEPGAKFRLKATAGGAISLRAEPASPGGQVGGTILMVLGVGLAAVSLVGVIIGAGASAKQCGPRSGDWCGLGQGIGTAILLVSGVGLIGGAGLAAGGAVLVSESGESTTQKPTPMSPTTGKAAFFVPLTFSF